MNKYQKETEKILLDHEKEVFENLKKTYINALAEIKQNIAQLKDDIDSLIKANPDNKSLIQSKVYQYDYQKVMEEQLNEILDAVKKDNVNNVQTFLKKMYEDSFLSINYHLQQKGIPVIMPINHKMVIDTINIPTEKLKFSTRFYKHVEDLKKTVKSEISRGIATGNSYKDIARQVSEVARIDLNKAYRIARTEGGRVSSTAKMDSMREAKRKGADIVKVWDATLDGNTRYLHRELDQQWAEVDKPFKVRGIEVMHPHGFGIASEDVNCRCSLLSVPRWDLEDKIVKLDNLSKELITCKNYGDWKQQYYEIVETKKVSYQDVTQKWLDEANPNSHVVKDRQYFEHEGAKYEVDNKNVVLDYSDKEKEIVEWLENTFGGEIYMNPRINYPKGIETADYLWNDELWDLKEIIKATSEIRAVDNVIKNCKNQSSNFIIDITGSKLSNKSIIKQVQNVFIPSNKFYREWVNKIIIKRDNEVLKIYIKK